MWEHYVQLMRSFKKAETEVNRFQVNQFVSHIKKEKTQRVGVPNKFWAVSAFPDKIKLLQFVDWWIYSRSSSTNFEWLYFMLMEQTELVRFPTMIR